MLIQFNNNKVLTTFTEFGSRVWLNQGSQTRGTRASSGPPDAFVRLANISKLTKNLWVKQSYKLGQQIKLCDSNKKNVTQGRGALFSGHFIFSLVTKLVFDF